jgi:septum formation protein
MTPMNRPAIILASTSAIRRKILDAAGVSYSVMRPEADEDALKQSFMKDGLGPEALSLALARGKALSVAAGEAYVIGADQIMELDGAVLDKPRSMRDAADRLCAAAGRAHRLVNGVCVVRDGAPVFEHQSTAVLTMRAMSRAEIEDYLSAAGEEVLSSVGAYQVEALGGRLFERIEGDFFTVLGLSLFPLIGFLKGEGALAW